MLPVTLQTLFYQPELKLPPGGRGKENERSRGRRGGVAVEQMTGGALAKKTNKKTTYLPKKFSPCHQKQVSSSSLDIKFDNAPLFIPHTLRGDKTLDTD